MTPVGLDHGEVGDRVRADDASRYAVLPSLNVTVMLAAARGRTRHDVVVGEDQPSEREDHAGALAARPGRWRLDRDDARQHLLRDRLHRARRGRSPRAPRSTSGR